MTDKRFPFWEWDVDKYKHKYHPKYWDLCRLFMTIHKTKYREAVLVNLTEMFYNMGIKRTKYRNKQTRMLSALAVEVLEEFLKHHPDKVKHPFLSVFAGKNSPNEAGKDTHQCSSSWLDEEMPAADSKEKTPDESKEKYEAEKEKTSSKKDKGGKSKKPENKPVLQTNPVDTSISVDIMEQDLLKQLLKDFVIIRDVSNASRLLEKDKILDDSFERSKFGCCKWRKAEDPHSDNMWVDVSWNQITLAKARGEVSWQALCTRLAQALLYAISRFAYSVKANQNYFRNGQWSKEFFQSNKNKYIELLNRQDKRIQFLDFIKNTIEPLLANVNFVGCEVILNESFTFAEKMEVINYFKDKGKIRIRRVTIEGQDHKNPPVCLYTVLTGEELCRQLLKDPSWSNGRYLLLQPGHKEPFEEPDDKMRWTLKPKEELSEYIKNGKQGNVEAKHLKANGVESTKNIMNTQELDNLKKTFPSLILFYGVDHNSLMITNPLDILYNSFKLSGYTEEQYDISVEIKTNDNLKCECNLKIGNLVMGYAESSDYEKAQKKAANIFLEKLKIFCYIIEAREDYFCNGSVPSFIKNPDTSKQHVFRLASSSDIKNGILPLLDNFLTDHSFKELIFIPDVTKEEKSQIMLYAKKKGLCYRWFSKDDKNTFLALYHQVDLQKLLSSSYEQLINGHCETDMFRIVPPEDKSLRTPSTCDSSQAINALLLFSANKKHALIESMKHNEEISRKKIKIEEEPIKPEGEFPGLIIWVGFDRYSNCVKDVFCALKDTFRLSRFGKLIVEESVETTPGKPLRKCVIRLAKNYRLLGSAVQKTMFEARNEAANYIMARLRKYCFAIQAKESYFLNGESLPNDKEAFEYKLVTDIPDKNTLVSIIERFARNVSNKELIFGHEFNLEVLRLIGEYGSSHHLFHRVINVPAPKKNMPKHAIALFHPRPELWANELLAGEDDPMYRLVPPGGKFTADGSDEDFWPDTLESTDDVKPSPKAEDAQRIKSEIRIPPNKETANNIKKLIRAAKKQFETGGNKQPKSETNAKTLPDAKADSQAEQVALEDEADDYQCPPDADPVIAPYAKSFFLFKPLNKWGTEMEQNPVTQLHSLCSLHSPVQVVMRKSRNPIISGPKGAKVSLPHKCEVVLVVDTKRIVLATKNASHEDIAEVGAALMALDIIKKSCRIIEPKYSYIQNEGLPVEFSQPSATYKIVKKKKPDTPVTEAGTMNMLFKFVQASDLQDLFIPATTTLPLDRRSIIGVVNNKTFGQPLGWRVIGSQGLSSDDKSKQKEAKVELNSLCVFKRRSTTEVIQELLRSKSGETQKYILLRPGQKQPDVSTTSAAQQPPSNPIVQNQPIAQNKPIAQNNPAVEDKPVVQKSMCLEEKKPGGCCVSDCKSIHENILDRIVSEFLSSVKAKRGKQPPP